MKLTLKSAELLAKKLFAENFKDVELKFRLKHCKDVLKVCVLLAKNKDVDLNKLKIAAWLHDVGRIEDAEKHPEKSLEIAEKEFGKVDEILADCIVNHGSKSKPKTKEGQLFQLADKLSLLSKELFIESLKDDKEGAINFFSDNLAKLLELAKGFDFKEEKEKKEEKAEEKTESA